MKEDRIIAIITARGGSKRIPRKNIKNFLGRPIIEYSIESALEAGIFDQVMVTTDDEEIAEIARRAGAKVPFLRSAKNSNDHAGTGDVLVEVLNQYKELGENFTHVCCIYPTAPFITAKKLREGFHVLKELGGSQLTPVVAYSFPPQRAFVVREHKLEMLQPEHRLTRSQDLEPVFHDCGQFYFYRVDKLLEGNGVIVDNIVPFVMPELEVQDIDNETDWKLAELKYQLMKEKGE